MCDLIVSPLRHLSWAVAKQMQKERRGHKLTCRRQNKERAHVGFQKVRRGFAALPRLVVRLERQSKRSLPAHLPTRTASSVYLAPHRCYDQQIRRWASPRKACNEQTSSARPALKTRWPPRKHSKLGIKREYFTTDPRNRIYQYVRSDSAIPKRQHRATQSGRICIAKSPSE